MIIPIAFEVSRKINFEDFDINAPLRSIVNVTPAPDFRLTVELFDTERRRSLGFSARVLIDNEAESGHELMTVLKVDGGTHINRRKYLHELRDAIDAELGERREDPPWDRTCEPAGEIMPEELDLATLRLRLNGLNHKQVGQVLGVMLGVLMERGINLTTFLPELVETIITDKDLAAGLRALGSSDK